MRINAALIHSKVRLFCSVHLAFTPVPPQNVAQRIAVEQTSFGSTRFAHFTNLGDRRKG
jgi:hypothetical protein